MSDQVQEEIPRVLRDQPEAQVDPEVTNRGALVKLVEKVISLLRGDQPAAAPVRSPVADGLEALTPGAVDARVNKPL